MNNTGSDHKTDDDETEVDYCKIRRSYNLVYHFDLDFRKTSVYFNEIVVIKETF